MKKLINAIIVLAILAGAVYFFMPGLWTKAEDLYKTKFGWTEEAKKQHPVDYLHFVLVQAKDEYSHLDSYISDHLTAIHSLSQELTKSRKIAGYDQQILSEMKSLYQQIQQSKQTWPVNYRDKGYTEDEFRQQIGVLLEEKSAHEQLASNLQSEIDTMQSRLGALKVAKSKYKIKINQIEANIKITRAKKGTDRIEEIVANADQVMTYVDTTRSSFSTPIRTAEELVRKNRADEQNADVDKFLRS